MNNIKGIEIVNFKNIKEFNQDFTNGVYLISGENDVGKSHLIQALFMLMTGTRSNDMLMEGKEEGYIKGTVGNYEITYEFDKANPRGTVKILDKYSGMETSKVTVLDQIFGYTDFNAGDFLSWSDTADGRRRQVDAIKELLGVEFKAKEQEFNIKVGEAMETRKNAKAKLEGTQIVLKNYDLPEDHEDEKYKKELVIGDLIAEKQTAADLNSEISESKATLSKIDIYLGVKEKPEIHYEKTWEEELDFEIGEYNHTESELIDTINEYEKKILELKEQKDNVLKNKTSYEAEMNDKKKLTEEQKGKYEKYLKDNKEVDTTEIQKKIDEAGGHNEKVNVIKSHGVLIKQQTAEAEVLKKAEKALVLARTSRDEFVKKAEIPVENLTWDDDGLLLNGIRFNKANISTSDQIMVAFKIVIASNPHIKVFKIFDGQCLGEAKFNAALKFAKDNGYQGFIEETRRGQDKLMVEIIEKE